MSAATMNGGDAAKSNNSGSKPLKSSNSGKNLDGARKQAASPVDGQIRKQQAPKAWQGPNPITQRASSNTTNGTEKPLPKLPQQTQQTKNPADLHADKHAHDRSIFLLSQFVGKDATITLKNGEQFTGTFSGGSFESSKTQYVIKMARRTKLPSHQQVNGNQELAQEYTGEGEDHTMSFDIQDTVDLFVPDVTTAAAAPQQNGSIASSFLTDTQISSRDSHLPRERPLQKWEPGPDTSVDLSLESAADTEWDQFAANERMYGVQSNYDENIYTTALNRNDPEFKRRQAQADRIAREIEGSAPANEHVAEERRRDASRGDDAGDEEDKYSGVRRESALPKRAAGAYVPPSQRPLTGTPTIPGAPFDPAIVSAQIKATPLPAVAPTAQPPIEQPAPTASSSTVPEIDTPAPVAPVAAPKAKQENTMEDRVRDTADAFKQFANNEKLRLRQAQEAKRSNQRQEKNVKLNDLKKFAANFKLKSRVPDDLVPILAKDHDKQKEIQLKAEEAAKEEEVRAKERESDKAPSVASPAPASAAAQAVPLSAGDPRPPFKNARPFPPQQLGRGGSHLAGQGQGQRQPLSQRIQGNFNNVRQGNLLPQPSPESLRIATTATQPEGPLSPSSARLNVNAKAFEFRPAASAFTPTGTSPSPQRTASMAGPSPSEAITTFFDKEKPKDSKSFPSAFDPIKRMAVAEYSEDVKKKYKANGGLPQAYNTLPTWPYVTANEKIFFLSYFPTTRAPSQGPSPMHTPNPNAQMPHAHQLPPHMHATPSQRQPYYQPPQHGHAPSFDPRMPQFGPGSVQNSPRAQQMNTVPFNAQMPQIPGPQYGQPMPPYGMSPSLQYRQPSAQGNPMMMPGQGQMAQMPPRGYPSGPQYGTPQMGGHMMVQQPSGSYMSGPMPQQGFSPMPNHAQPHMPHLHGPAGYSQSPRPPMMTHQGSHQGFQPGMMQPHFAPSPGQQHPFHFQNQQRAMSGGQFSHMTPRQQHVMPTHASPGMGVPAQGDEGK